MPRGLKNIEESFGTFLKLDVESELDLPVCLQVEYDGFWTTNCNRNSVILKPNSLLYVYKLAFRHLLLSMNVITPHDIDSQNLVPHIVVRKSNTDPKLVLIKRN